MRTVFLRLIATAVVVGLLAAPAASNQMAGYKLVVTKQDFETAVFALENAIVDRGLVIDTTGHVGAMLKRTAKATGAGSPYIGARYLGFCSAKLSAEAMAVNSDNLAICPYVMFVFELRSEPGKSRIGYRRPVGGDDAASKKSLAAIEKLLADILKEATQ